MGEYLITAPSGKKYKVTGETREGALAALQKMIGGDGAAQAASATPMQERLAAAKAGTLQMQPGSAERADAADAAALAQMQPTAQPPGMIEDVLKSAGAGLARGGAAILDMPSEMMGLGINGAELLTGKQAPDWLNAAAAIPTGGLTRGTTARELMGNITGGATEYKGQTTPGQYAGTLGEFLPGSMIGGATVGNALRYGVVPALASETAGQVTEGTALEPWARLVAGLAAPMAVGAVSKVARAGVTSAADPERLKLAKVLDDFGVPITAGQRTGAKGLRRVEAASGRGQAIADAQTDEFTRAALGTIGETATRATSDVLDAAAARIGSVFDDATRGIDITPDRKTVTDFAAAMETYRQMAPKATAVPLLQNINTQIVRGFRGGTPIPAATMNTWRSNLSKLTTSADQATRDAALLALEAVDDAMSASLTAAGRANDVARLTEARGQWRNYLAIQGAVGRAGEEAAAGIVSPARLASEVTRQGKASYVRGKRGDIGALAKAGVGVMSPLPTVEAGGMRSIAGLPQIASAGIGAGLGSMAGPGGAAIGSMLGAAAPSVYAAGMASRPMQGYLARALAGEGGRIFDPRTIGVIPGMMAGR